MRAICKAFNSVPALINVDFELRSGEVHVLVGENGAGKSTLMKILTGEMHPDSGTVSIDGKQIQIKTPLDAKRLGIGSVHQELMLAPHLSVAQNIFLGREPVKATRIVDWKRLYADAKRLLEELNIPLDAEAPVNELTVAQRQLVEIAKVLSQNPRILILDEPTSALTETEIDLLLNKVTQLKSKGIGIVYITHKMEEIHRIADRSSVLRDGENAGSLKREDFDVQKLIEMMVGRKDITNYQRVYQKVAEPILEVRNLSNHNVRNIGFTLHRGEILGIAGLMGSGRSEMARALFGIDRINQGEVFLENEKLKLNHPRRSIKFGMGFAPEDRKEQALLLEMPLWPNISISKLFRRKSGIRKISAEKRLAKEYISRLSIKASGIRQTTKSLSGGNQQKVVISRWLATDPKILILDEPTRGIDIGTKTEIYELLSQMTQNGVSVIVISSELHELVAICDRILVMCEGQISGELNHHEFSQERIMALAIGEIN